ncbi:TPA: hypothetical protein JTJ34_003122 [Escherichia coli]|nr:hypothetical protein [Escherichia coli]HAV7945762.1 hypothetical protein [Escherichia coli]HAX7849031.1 hypothetical protein [Escherichia coli]
MEFHESAICDFRANANSVKPQPIQFFLKQWVRGLFYASPLMTLTQEWQ